MFHIQRINANKACSSCGKPASGIQPVYRVKTLCNRQQPETMHLCKGCAKELRKKLSISLI